jgi:hypothetical protein
MKINNKVNGVLKLYFANGIIVDILNFINDINNGIWVNYSYGLNSSNSLILCAINKSYCSLNKYVKKK